MLNINEIIQGIFAKYTWKVLNDRNVNNIENGNWPGIYLLAFANENLEDKLVTPKTIFYVGMSNAGVKSRINQFRFAIEKGYSHSAGNRFYEDYCDKRPFSESNFSFKFYFIEKTFSCVVIKNLRTAEDLKILGEICNLEYNILAHIKEYIQKEPELN